MFKYANVHLGGDNTTHHDIDEVRRECESKIEALDTKWKIKQFIWQLSVLSLIQQLYSTTTGEHYIHVMM